MSKLEKTLGKFSQMADTLHGVSTLTPAGKLMMAGSHLTDALGVPALSLVNLEAKGFKEAGKGIG